MTVRIVKIHRGPSDECPYCHDGDGTCWMEDGTPKGGAIAGLCFVLGLLLILGIVLFLWGSA